MNITPATNPSPSAKQQSNQIRYVALGDSYTIGEGVAEKDNWPSQLTKHLQKEDVNIELIANPSVSGWTTQDVIDRELDIYDTSNPTFATLLIGGNDWVQGVSPQTYQANLTIILDRMQQKLPNKKNIILVTIPDFSVTPLGQRYTQGRDFSESIQVFNTIIKDEGKNRDIPVVDVFELSQGMKDNPDLVVSDGLHPSAEEYSLWEEKIFPVAFKMLSE